MDMSGTIITRMSLSVEFSADDGKEIKAEGALACALSFGMEAHGCSALPDKLDKPDAPDKPEKSDKSDKPANVDPTAGQAEEGALSLGLHLSNVSRR
mgnify:CR=1 FL=1